MQWKSFTYNFKILRQAQNDKLNNINETIAKIVTKSPHEGNAQIIKKMYTFNLNHINNEIFTNIRNRTINYKANYT